VSGWKTRTLRKNWEVYRIPAFDRGEPEILQGVKELKGMLK
jgi:hypothetical protein